MEESAMQVCPICGITREEQEFQQQLVGKELHTLRERWEQHHGPNEPPPGLPLTHEHRVHFALYLLDKNDSSEKPDDAAIALAARKVRVDPELVAKAHANRA